MTSSAAADELGPDPLAFDPWSGLPGADAVGQPGTRLPGVKFACHATEDDVLRGGANTKISHAIDFPRGATAWIVTTLQVVACLWSVRIIADDPLADLEAVTHQVCAACGPTDASMGELCREVKDYSLQVLKALRKALGSRQHGNLIIGSLPAGSIVAQCFRAVGIDATVLPDISTPFGISILATILAIGRSFPPAPSSMQEEALDSFMNDVGIAAAAVSTDVIMLLESALARLFGWLRKGKRHLGRWSLFWGHSSVYEKPRQDGGRLAWGREAVRTFLDKPCLEVFSFPMPAGRWKGCCDLYDCFGQLVLPACRTSFEASSLKLSDLSVEALLRRAWPDDKEFERQIQYIMTVFLGQMASILHDENGHVISAGQLYRKAPREVTIVQGPSRLSTRATAVLETGFKVRIATVAQAWYQIINQILRQSLNPILARDPRCAASLGGSSKLKGHIERLQWRRLQSEMLEVTHWLHISLDLVNATNRFPLEIVQLANKFLALLLPPGAKKLMKFLDLEQEIVAGLTTVLKRRASLMGEGMSFLQLTVVNLAIIELAEFLHSKGFKTLDELRKLTAADSQKLFREAAGSYKHTWVVTTCGDDALISMPGETEAPPILFALYAAAELEVHPAKTIVSPFFGVIAEEYMVDDFPAGPAKAVPYVKPRLYTPFSKTQQSRLVADGLATLGRSVALAECLHSLIDSGDDLLQKVARVACICFESVNPGFYRELADTTAQLPRCLGGLGLARSAFFGTGLWPGAFSHKESHRAGCLDWLYRSVLPTNTTPAESMMVWDVLWATGSLDHDVSWTRVEETDEARSIELAGISVQPGQTLLQAIISLVREETDAGSRVLEPCVGAQETESARRSGRVVLDALQLRSLMINWGQSHALFEEDLPKERVIDQIVLYAEHNKRVPFKINEIAGRPGWSKDLFPEDPVHAVYEFPSEKEIREHIRDNTAPDAVWCTVTSYQLFRSNALLNVSVDAEWFSKYAPPGGVLL